MVDAANELLGKTYVKGWEVGLGSLGEERVSAQSPVLFVFVR